MEVDDMSKQEKIRYIALVVLFVSVLMVSMGIGFDQVGLILIFGTIGGAIAVTMLGLLTRRLFKRKQAYYVPHTLLVIVASAFISFYLRDNGDWSNLAAFFIALLVFFILVVSVPINFILYEDKPSKQPSQR